MKKANKSCYVVLGLLSKHDLSGYDIKQIASKISRFYWSESNAQIYPVLKKLEAADLVTSHLDESSGARKKRIYKITKKGHEFLMAWLTEPAELTPYREEQLLHLAFAVNLSDSEVHEQLNHYHAQLQDKLKLYDEVIAHIETSHKTRADKRHLLILYDHVKGILDAKISWAKRAMKEYAA